MIGSPSDLPASDGWEAAGQRIAAELDGTSAALVIGVDPVAAAEVALGIARVQARRRRVAVADVVGELPPIEAQLAPGVAHGIVDAFLYGVSLNKVAQPIDPARNLLILPSGATPIDHEALLGSARWTRLASGFRDAGALLLVLAPELAAALASLAPRLDGVVLVGDAVAPPGAPVIARASLPEPVAPERPAELSAPEAAAEPATGRTPEPAAARPAEPAPPPPRPTPRVGSRLLTPASVARSVRKPTPVEPAATIPPAPAPPPREHGDAPPLPGGASDRTAALHREYIADRDAETPPSPPAVVPAAGRPASFWIGVAAAAAVVIALLAWGARRITRPPAAPVVVADTALTPPAATNPIDTAAAITAVATGDAVVNPTDSATAAHWAVAMIDFGSESGANRRFDRELDRNTPAVTWIPMQQSDTARRVYRVVSGAYADRATADSLLRSLRARGVLGRGAGHLIDAPFALLVQRGVARDDVSIFLHGRQLAGLPVYALVQPDGRVNVYAGAFESAAAARLLLPKFRANGEQPRVAYRTGRPL